NEIIPEKREKIKELKEDIKNGIQRKPRDNESIIKARYFTNFRYQLQHNIRAHYSLGDPVNVLDEVFVDAVQDLEKYEDEDTGYLNLRWILYFQIILESNKENIKSLSEIIKKQNVNDFVIDYLLCARDIGWTQISNNFVEEIPYAKIKEIIELEEKDKAAASHRLFTYMDKKCIKEHHVYTCMI